MKTIPVNGNFAALTESRMVDAALKIAIQAGRFELDDSSQGFTIQYDPQLSSDGLWRERSGDDRDLMLRFFGRDAAERPIPFMSEARKDVVSFTIEEDWQDDTLMLTLKLDRSGYLFMRQTIQTKIGAHIGMTPDALIRYVIDSMPKWYGLEQIGRCQWKDLKTLTFLIETSFAECLSDLRPLAWPPNGRGYVTFEQREIA